MGWTVLYIAFGCVALWLLGEVLLQYKARLRWRLLAFTGFLGVVIGVLMPSILVIFVGTVAFATGQLFVTLSFRRGFSTGWAIGGKPGSSRRRRSEEDAPPPAVDAEPVLEVSQLEETPTYQPLPLPDDTGQYGVYERDEDELYAAQGQGQSYGQSPGQSYGQPGQPVASPQSGYATAGYESAAFDTGPLGASSYDTGSYGSGPAYGSGSHDYDTGSFETGSYDTAAYSQPSYGGGSWDTGSYTTERYQDTYGSPLYSAGDEQPYQDNYGYGTGQYSAYPGPYAGGEAGPMPPASPAGPNDLYDPLAGDYQAHSGYPAPPSGAAPYGEYDSGQYPTTGYPPETPPGGVWVPQQREPDLTQPPPYPPQDNGGYDYYNPQQRY